MYRLATSFWVSIRTPSPHRVCRLRRDFGGFQCNLVYGLALALVGHSGIDLCRRDVLVAKDMLDGIDTRASLDL